MVGLPSNTRVWIVAGRAMVASKQFERWSHEDALTGVAICRHVEQPLADRLQALVTSGRPLAVALVDIDQFKSVNDRFTHQVGDRVLKTMAAVVASQLRENDMPARWAGNAFVILFDKTPVDVASQVCARVRASVSSFDWESIAPGLRMSVSIGLSETLPGDTTETVLHRSDQAMYLAKPKVSTFG